MLLLAIFISLIILIVTITVGFVAAKLFAHFRAVAQAEEMERSEFTGIRKNSTFAKLIEKSFANQTVTLAKTMEDEELEQVLYQCSYCNMVQLEVRGEWDCCHCGASMAVAKSSNDEIEIP